MQRNRHAVAPGQHVEKRRVHTLDRAGWNIGFATAGPLEKYGFVKPTRAVVNLSSYDKWREPGVS